MKYTNVESSLRLVHVHFTNVNICPHANNFHYSNELMEYPVYNVMWWHIKLAISCSKLSGLHQKKIIWYMYVFFADENLANFSKGKGTVARDTTICTQVFRFEGFANDCSPSKCLSVRRVTSRHILILILIGYLRSNLRAVKNWCQSMSISDNLKTRVACK